MVKILVINTPGLDNRGGMGIVLGAIDCFKRIWPDASITLVSHHYINDKIEIEEIELSKNVHFLRHPWYLSDKSVRSRVTTISKSLRFLFLTVFSRFFKTSINLEVDFKKYDVIIDLNADSLNDFYNKYSSLFMLYNTFCGIASGKPVVVSGASIGPYKNRLLRFINYLLLNNVELITVREPNSLAYLSFLGVTKPKIYLTADYAFLMSPKETAFNQISKELLLTKGPLIGVTIPGGIIYSRNPKEHQKLMTLVTNMLTEKFGATVLLIPHAPTELPLLQEIFNFSDRASSIKVVNLYSAPEQKGVMMNCDGIISFKFHPLVGSVSAGVPSVGVVTYGAYKFYGVFGKMMDLGRYLIDGDQTDVVLLQQIENKLNYLLQNQKTVKRDFYLASEQMVKNALRNGELIKELVI